MLRAVGADEAAAKARMEKERQRAQARDFRSRLVVMAATLAARWSPPIDAADSKQIAQLSVGLAYDMMTEAEQYLVPDFYDPCGDDEEPTP